MISTVIIMIIDVQQSCPGIKVDVTRSIQEASLSDLSHILSSSDIVKKRRTMLLLNKSYEVVNINKCIFSYYKYNCNFIRFLNEGKIIAMIIMTSIYF